jgi:putative copper export protein
MMSTVTGTASTLTIVRLSLHVLAATIFVGGQLVVAGMLPTIRSIGGDAPTRIARAFARLAWPAFLVLVATGIWNITADDPSTKTSAWKVVLGVKIAVVVLAAAAAAIHQRARSKKVVGATGGLAGLFALAAVVLGVALAG